MMKLQDINTKPTDDFVAYLGGVFEHSPWVVEAAADARPFKTVKALQAACERALYGATPETQLALIHAHPDLAAKLDQLEELTEFSRQEQDRAGFMRLPAAELDALRVGLASYRERFGHPFILCVTEHAASDVLPMLEVRLQAQADAERLACLFQIARIGWHRICSLLED
jgi:2-oxo-4-hydroxy-4-carboxy-5-ureidoimidazoline decarboxylase